MYDMILTPVRRSSPDDAFPEDEDDEIDDDREDTPPLVTDPE